MKPLITNIQRFCVHDGPGIRTTVFFKGCTLHCPWCANPENIHFDEETFFISEKCISSCKYIKECLQKKYPKECPYGAIGKWGKYFTEEKLYNELIKDKNFYGAEGGITFSGGEPLLFLCDYEWTLNRLRQDGIDMAVETALNVSEQKVKWSASYIDRFYVDIKTVDESIFNYYIGGDIDLYKKNVTILKQLKNIEKIVFRVPIVSYFLQNSKVLLEVKKYLDEIEAKNIEIFSVHNLARKKYERLGRIFTAYETISEESLIEIKKLFQSPNRSVEIKHI